MISTDNFRRGARIELDGEPFAVIEAITHNPTARGSNSLVKCKLRNLRTGLVLSRSFKAGELFKEPDLARRTAQFLYSDGNEYHFMDAESYEQVSLNAEALGDQAVYLKDGLEVALVIFNGQLIAVDLPQFVELQVVMVEPGAKGDTASGKVTSTATLENDLKVQVPLYIREGDMVRIDPRTGQFQDRV